MSAAYLYGTEKVVAEAIKESGIPREEVFVTTKLPWHHTSRVEYSLDQSLANLKAGLGHGEYYDLVSGIPPESGYIMERDLCLVSHALAPGDSLRRR